ncbi:MAG: CARDB domain-containing protein, partial [Kiritimatiellales bacterium]
MGAQFGKAKRLMLAALFCAVAGGSFAETMQYSYDTMQRLTRVQHGDGTTIDYVYDNLGNRLVKTTTLAGAPSNQPPAAVTNPGIANGLTNVLTTGAVLSWSPAVDPDSGDSVVYFIYFGTSPTPPLAYSGWTTNWSPGHLRGLTTYYWQIVARDSQNNQTASPVWSFTTENEPPVADFTASPVNGWAPLIVTFTDRSFDTDNAIVSRQWDFDNNGTVDSTNRNPTFTYTNPGDYTVTLTVRDEAAAATTKTNLVHVVGSGIVDLSPLGLNVQSAGPSYRQLTVVYSVTNQGTVSLSGVWQWADTFYISTNAVLDGQATQIGTFYENQTLPAGTVYTRTNVVTIPDVAAQNYYLFLKADGQNQIGELSEGNNVVVVPLTNNLPDLVTTSLSVSGEAVAGQSIQVTCAVINQGYLPIDADWYDSIYLSVNPTWEPSDTQISAVHINLDLGPGDGYSSTNTVTLPAWPPGDYYLIARADANNWLVELNEVNNAIAIPITLSVPVVVSGPDVAPVSVDVQGVAQSGRSVSVVTIVTNCGPGVASSSSGYWSDRLYLSTNAVWDAGEDYLLGSYSHSGTLANGGTYAQTNTVTLPSGLGSGTYYLILQADYNNNLAESVETNNVLAIPVTLVLPDLAPVSLSTEGVPQAGRPLTVTYAVTNQG